MKKIKKYKLPIFKQVDLTKSGKDDDGNESEQDCSNIKTDGTEYLCLIDGDYFIGTFIRVWYGISFDGWLNHLQYDKPGTNSSMWQSVWEIVK